MNGTASDARPGGREPKNLVFLKRFVHNIALQKRVDNSISFEGKNARTFCGETWLKGGRKKC
ncbi:MAG: hypothetical protein KAV87_63940 [Desulfobacteraceae bacterium]|nr:hypothetical protein [Desulfobacteraceae bacterium]